MKCLKILDPRKLLESLMYKIMPPSPSTSMRFPTHVELAPFKKGIKSDDPPQNVDKPHLSASISTITNLDVTCTLDTSCDHCFIWILPAIHLIHKTSQVLKMLKLNLLMSLKNLWKIISLHQQMPSMNTMTMNCSYYKIRLMHQMVISTIRTLITVKIKMTFSFMSPS